jgi:hypothetical protein
MGDEDDGNHKNDTETVSVASSSSVYTRAAVNDIAASTSLSSNSKTQPDNTHDAATALVSLGRSETNPSTHAVASVPSVSEEKYQQLHGRLLKMMKQFHSYGMIQVLEDTLSSIKDKQSTYKDKCDDFCTKIFGDVGTAYRLYLKKMIGYSGLLIHDIVGVGHSTNLRDHQKVFVHVLSYCIGSNDPNGSHFWRIFFGKLIPRSAEDSGDVGIRIWLYFRKCLNSMKMVAPPNIEKQLGYYYQHNYLSDASGKVGKEKNIGLSKESGEVMKTSGRATSTKGEVKKTLRKTSSTKPDNEIKRIETNGLSPDLCKTSSTKPNNKIKRIETNRLPPDRRKSQRMSPQTNFFSL